MTAADAMDAAELEAAPVRSAILSAPLSPLAKLLAIVIMDAAIATGRPCELSVTQLGAELGSGRRRVARALRELSDAGVLETGSAAGAGHARRIVGDRVLELWPEASR